MISKNTEVLNQIWPVLLPSVVAIALTMSSVDVYANNPSINLSSTELVKDIKVTRDAAAGVESNMQGNIDLGFSYPPIERGWL